MVIFHGYTTIFLVFLIARPSLNNIIQNTLQQYVHFDRLLIVAYSEIHLKTANIITGIVSVYFHADKILHCRRL